MSRAKVAEAGHGGADSPGRQTPTRIGQAQLTTAVMKENPNGTGHMSPHAGQQALRGRGSSGQDPWVRGLACPTEA